MDQPKVAVIGCGRWGANIIRNLSELGVLAGVIDVDEEKRNLQSEKYSVNAYPSLDALLSQGSVDAVALATPSETHAEIALEALERDLDVFVEKPMATRVSDGERMVGIAKQRGRILMVGHLLEYHGAVLKLKELIDSGEMGKIEYAYSNRLNMGQVRQEENALWSFAPHDVAVLLLLIGKMPIQVTATGGSYLQPNIADVTVTNLLFDGGLRSHIFVSWLHPFKEQKLVVTGTQKMVVFNDVLPDNKLVLFDRNIENRQGELVAHRVEGEPIQYDKTEPLKKECQHFVDCVRERTQPKTDGLNGLRVLSVLQASQRSIQVNGEPIVLRSNLQEIIYA